MPLGFIGGPNAQSSATFSGTGDFRRVFGDHAALAFRESNDRPGRSAQPHRVKRVRFPIPSQAWTRKNWPERATRAAAPVFGIAASSLSDEMRASPRGASNTHIACKHKDLLVHLLSHNEQRRSGFQPRRPRIENPLATDREDRNLTGHCRKPSPQDPLASLIPGSQPTASQADALGLLDTSAKTTSVRSCDVGAHDEHRTMPVYVRGSPGSTSTGPRRTVSDPALGEPVPPRGRALPSQILIQL